jgi:predicted kinase
VAPNLHPTIYTVWCVPSTTPVLICLSGLPGSGKSTVARLVVQQLRAGYVRVDTIETAITRAEGVHAAGNGWELPPGYAVGYDLAAEQLRLGLDVVVESVNPLATTRDSWRRTAEANGAVCVEVELVCSDTAEHRRRVENRSVDVKGLILPTWAEVGDREYEPWHRDRLVVDTAAVGVEEAARMVAAARG